MREMLHRCVSVCLLGFATAASGVAGAAEIVTTIAGPGPRGPVPGTAISFRTYLLAEDPAGNLVFGDSSHNVVWRLDSFGSVTRIAGNSGVAYRTSDAVSATGTALRQFPIYIDYDAAGNAYLASFSDVRRVAPNGSIATLAGPENVLGYSGDGGPAAQASFERINAIASDPLGNVYIADLGRIRRIDAASGIIQTIAGTGQYASSGDGGPATLAQIAPTRMVWSSSSLLFVEQDFHRVRRIDLATGVIEAVAGTGLQGSDPDGPDARVIRIDRPFGIDTDVSGNVYFAESGQRRVRRIDAMTGTVTTIATLDFFPFNDLEIIGSRLILSADAQILELTANGLRPIAGTGHPSISGDGGLALDAQLGGPVAVVSDGAGIVYFADAGALRRIDNGIVSTVASIPFFIGGLATGSSGEVFVSARGEFGSSGSVLRVFNGVVETVFGNGQTGAGEDGLTGLQSPTNTPNGIALSASGDLYIAEGGNHRVRVLRNGVVTTVAGSGVAGFAGDGGDARAALLDTPTSIALAPNGDLFIAEQSSFRVRRVRNGIIETVAGNGVFGGVGSPVEGIPATQSALPRVHSIAVDVDGVLYIKCLDGAIYRVRDGVLTRFAGVSYQLTFQSYGGDGGLARDAIFDQPATIAFDRFANRVLVADTTNRRVRAISVDPPPVDTTPPQITALAPTPSPSGWYRGPGPTTLSWRIVDFESPVQIQSGCQSVSLSTDTGPEGVTFTCSASSIGGTTTSSITIARDGTPPVVSVTRSPTPLFAPWNTGPVLISATATDALSGLAGCTAPVTATQEGISILGNCRDIAGNVAIVTAAIDSRPPAVTARVIPMPNAAGWNNGPVSVSFSGVDPLPPASPPLVIAAASGVRECSAPVTVTADGRGQVAAGTCTDRAGNVSASTLVESINIDTAPPLISSVRTPAPGPSGWHRTPVTVAFAGADALAGVALDGCTAPVSVATEGRGQSVVGSCRDLAGNEVSTVVEGIDIDLTPPQVVATATPAPNAAGWNRSDVTVSFSATDAVTGSGVATCSAPVALSREAIDNSASGTCADIAGNIGDPATIANIRIDMRPPTISVVVPVDGATYQQGQVVRASYLCSDDLSGTAGCNGTVASGTAIDTRTPGPKSFEVSALDVAGNSVTVRRSYTVVQAYSFAGFRSPVAGPPVINRVDAGDVIPVRWRLVNPSGQVVSDPTTFIGISSVAATCTAAPVNNIDVDANPALAGTLRFDASRGTFTFFWPTSRNWRGCRTLQLQLSDGSTRIARFRF